MFAWLASIVFAPPAPSVSERVVVPVHELVPGRVITAADLVEVPFPHALVDGNAILDAPALVGRVPRERLIAGEPVRDERLVPAGRALGPPGWVELRIPAVASPIAPGNYVELLAGTDAGAVWLTPLAIVREALPGELLLAVDPAHADAIAAAALTGPILPVLRNDVDVTHVQTHGPPPDRHLPEARPVGEPGWPYPVDI